MGVALRAVGLYATIHVEAEGETTVDLPQGTLDLLILKAIALEHLVGVWDHAFLVYRGDTKVREFLESLPGHKTVGINRIPTVENLAAIAFEILARVYDAHYGVNLRLAKVRLYETPNCWADVTGD